MLYHQTVQFSYFALALAALFPFFLYRRNGPVFTTLWSAFLVIATIKVFEFPDVRGDVVRIPLNPEVLFIKTQGLQFLVLLYVLPMATALKQTTRSFLIKIVFWYLVVDTAYLFYSSLRGEHVRGFMDAHTFDLAVAFTFVGSLLPLSSLKNASKLYLLCIGFIAITALAFGGSTVLLSLGAGTYFWGLHHLWVRDFEIDRRQLWACRLLTVLGTGAFIGVLLYGAYHHISATPFEGSRLEIWSRMYTRWQDAGYPLLGFGVGAHQWFGLYNPASDGVRYVIGHGDFVQVLYELGPVGLVLFMALIGYTMYHLRRSVTSFVIGAMYVSIMISYFPLHFPASILLGVLLIGESNYYRSIRSQNPLA